MYINIFNNTKFFQFIIVIFIFIFSSCSYLFFHPEKEYVILPSYYGFSFESIDIPLKINQIQNDKLRSENPKSLTLKSWYINQNLDKSKSYTKDNLTGDAQLQPNNENVILFLHGNAQNMSYHLPSIEWIIKSGFNVMTFDYPGFGFSEGTPNFNLSFEGIESVFEYLIEVKKIKKIIVYGQSLGGAFAVYSVSNTKYINYVYGLITEGAFSDYREVTIDVLKKVYFPFGLRDLLSLTINNKFSPIKFVSKIQIPKLYIHGKDDNIVSFYHSQKLFDKSITTENCIGGKEDNCNKELWLVEGANHLGTFTSPENQERLKVWLLNHFNDSKVSN